MLGTRELKVNTFYRITFRTGRQKHPRVMVAQYLGCHDRDKPFEELVFNLRPLAGTSRLRTEDVLDIEKVKHTPVMLPKVVRPKVTA